MPDSHPSTLIKRTIGWLATWFGCGRFPKAPGTFGTIGAIPLVWTFGQLGPYGYMFATFAFTVLAIFVSHFYLEIFGTGSDPKEVVIDEVVGFLITMTWLPFHWKWWLAGFLLFRFFDILKPYPISAIDKKMKGGMGVVADDMLAGIIASVILQFIYTKGLMP